MIAVANKCDTGAIERLGLGELCRLGFGEPLPISANDGYGRSDLCERIAEELERLFPAGDGGAPGIVATDEAGCKTGGTATAGEEQQPAQPSNVDPHEYPPVSTRLSSS